jgi:hypothetical protein
MQSEVKLRLAMDRLRKEEGGTAGYAWRGGLLWGKLRGVKWGGRGEGS